MDNCLIHGGGCPYSTQAECSEMVSQITEAVREADREFQKVGGSTRHFVRECLIPCLVERGFMLIKTPNRQKVKEKP